MGGGLAAVFVFWVHPCWGPLAGCSLFSPLFECSACHSLDCLVSFIGAGSTRDGRRACCCFRVLLGSPVLGSVGWFCSLFSPLFECSAYHSSDICFVSYHGVGSTRVGRRACCFSLLFTEFGATRNFYKAAPPYSPPPPSLPCQVPSPYNGTAYVLWPRCSFTPYSSSHNAYIKV